MLKKTMALVLFLPLLAYAGCTSGEKKDELTPVAATSPSPTPEPNISYGQGFSDMEREPGGNTWRWMAEEGVIKLKNTKRDMTLKLKGDVPLGSLPKPPNIKLQLNGTQLDEIKAAPATVEKEYTITAAQQGAGDWSELRITSDKFFVPKEVDKNSADPRHLAFSLRQLTWEPK